MEASENLVIATGYAKGYSRKTNKQIKSKWAITLEFDEEGMLVNFVDIFDTVQLANARK